MRHPPDPPDDCYIILRLHIHVIVHVVNILHILVLIVYHKVLTDNHVVIFDFSNGCYIQY